jgi:hypothetical protein
LSGLIRAQAYHAYGYGMGVMGLRGYGVTRRMAGLGKFMMEGGERDMSIRLYCWIGERGLLRDKTIDWSDQTIWFVRRWHEALAVGSGDRQWIVEYYKLWQ